MKKWIGHTARCDFFVQQNVGKQGGENKKLK